MTYQKRPTRCSGSQEKPGEIEITPEMIEAGSKAILEEIGGADLGGFFSAPDLAVEVYRAMRRQQK